MRIDDPLLIPVAPKFVAESGNNLMCVVLDSGVAIEEVHLSEELNDIPIILMATSMGRFRGIAKKIQLFRKLNLRIFLSNKDENLTALRIISSLGIPCSITMENTAVDWGSLADLMTYAILEQMPHAPIEPFSYIAEHYKPNDYTQWNSLYFEDPNQFLHLDPTGQIALSHKDLLSGKFVGHIDKFDDAFINAQIEEGERAITELFISNHSCSRCPGFRVCLGKFMHSDTELNGCADFFAELMHVVELRRAQSRAKEGAQNGNSNIQANGSL